MFVSHLAFVDAIVRTPSVRHRQDKRFVWSVMFIRCITVYVWPVGAIAGLRAGSHRYKPILAPSVDYRTGCKTRKSYLSRQYIILRHTAVNSPSVNSSTWLLIGPLAMQAIPCEAPAGHGYLMDGTGR